MIRRLLLITLTAGWLSPAIAADTSDMQEQARPCAACHGEQGRAAADGYYPRIAGKPAAYLLSQLRNFKQGQRRYEPMTHLLKNMDDAYLNKLAHYFANLDLPYPPPSPDKQSPKDKQIATALINGQQRAPVRPACTDCHADDLMGDGHSVPPLLGLSVDYINAQFGAWRNGIRKTNQPDCMNDIARDLTPNEINTIAAWLAAQPVPAKTPRQRLTDFPLPCAAPAPVHKEPVDAISRGQYIALAGNCAGCHSVPDAAPYSGGRKIQTPFGAIWSTNLTPDTTTGLGKWNADDFFTAMTQGISRDGHALYPVFPYANYSGITRSDSDALFQWLQTLPPVNKPPKENDLDFPYSTRTALWAWRELYFSPNTFVPDPAKSEQHNRGAYLVEVLGHCSACHGKRNRFGAVAGADPFGGQRMPDARWYSPSLLDPTQGGLQQQSIPNISKLLGTGKNEHVSVGGPMADIVFDSLQHLTEADRIAMSVYLKSLPKVLSRQTRSTGDVRASKQGKSLYEDHCAQCHGENGRSEHYPKLAGNRAVTQADLTNLISTMLLGGYLPTTKGNPHPLGMPPFSALLSDKEIAQVLTFIRSAWGNRAAAVNASDVSRLR